MSNEPIRINRYLALCGIASRRAADELVRAGRVKLNGQVVTALGTRVDPARDVVEFDGRPVRPQEKTVYVLLNKPPGYITTAKDERRRPTVLDLVRIPQRVFPVGRLDEDTEGALLLTNDGALAYRLAHPRYEVKKVYHAVTDKPVTPEDLERLRRGVVIETGPTAPCEARYLEGPRSIELTLHEGKKRQVRRMFRALGYRVEKLRRVSIGGVELGDLPVGKWRYLTPEEIASLRRQVGLEG
ncbi:MAG: rRNA pseudouridine synthase [candidate division KSB1 bacterium]|nr:rRNA pseudouridine synthase [candidate division KSB1 bacterium]